MPSFNINFWSLKTRYPHIFASHFSQCHIFELEVLSLPKACYSNARHQFCMNSALLPLRAILHLIKNCNTKGAYPPIKYDCLHVSPLYQNSDLIQSKVYYSNRRHQLWMNWALLSLRPILHLRKNSEHWNNLVCFFLIRT